VIQETKKEPQVQSGISRPQAAKYQDTGEKLSNGTVFDDFLESSWPHHQYLESEDRRSLKLSNNQLNSLPRSA
jgi:hypothetical protein